MTAPSLLTYIAAALGLQLSIAASVAWWRRSNRQPPSQGTYSAAPPRSGAWPGWREFRVERRDFADAAHTQCSFFLTPVDSAPLAAFEPGQFLTFQLPVAENRRIIRCYSLSDRPAPNHFRVTVKRVLAPSDRPDLPAGEGSRYFHEQLKAGDTVQVRAPAGRFVAVDDPRSPVVLLAGGIGITPLLCMLRSGLLAEPARQVHLFYGVRNGGELAFRDELLELVRLHANFHLHLSFSKPTAQDLLDRDYQHAGHIDVDLLRRTLPSGRHRFYVCGPPTMLASLLAGLAAWGVPPDDVHHEAFGPASLQAVPGHASAPVSSSAVGLEVVFSRSERTLVWDGAEANLLEFAERHGIPVESGCRSGSCGSCEVGLASGSVRYAEPPEREIRPGSCLLCVATPTTPLKLEV
ncbi:MAG: 2Fe-2S iron-sulfur cluster binding domain-containing protein [Deltaproteobacteria bacterium]|nr:2Fe-2S iron-sulfur cluster binding domain-containing protein [Deltaproteobacteria bacterium]